MTDRITIKIETDIDNPNGPTVVDVSTAELGIGPGGVPLIDLVAAAFADGYGVHAVADPDDPDAEPVPVTAWKNVSYHVRQYMTNITLAYANKQIDAQATSQKQATAAAALGAVSVVEEPPQ